MIYVALLRGINVGGNNKVDMKILKVTFESLGFTNVVTYINSGNIVFEDSTRGQKSLACKIEDAIKRDFKLDIKVLVKSFEEIELICRQLPDTWVKNEVMRTDVCFCGMTLTIPKFCYVKIFLSLRHDFTKTCYDKKRKL